MALTAYVFITAKAFYLLKSPVIFLSLITWLLFRNKIKHPIVWFTFFVLLSFDLFRSYLWVANHHFMLMLIVLSIISYKYHKREAILVKNIQVLLVVVVLTSTLQKLFSHQFMSGEFYYDMMNRGALFRNFVNFFPDSVEIIDHNVENLSSLKSSDPNDLDHIIIKDIFPNLAPICQIFAYITVTLEFTVAMAILTKPKHILTHLFLITLILGILCTRLETGFMNLLAICGLFLCHNLKMRLLYIIIALGCLTLVITKYGYH
ncbi:MAG: hypothetical protein WBA19_09640 [Psychroserpens sp.]